MKLTPLSAWPALLLLAACAGTPPPPDWKLNAHGLLQAYAKHYLDGHTRQAERQFERARAEIARTGRPDWVARAELMRCAVRLAALEVGPCRGYETLAQHASAAERAYARFIAGEWQGLDADLLPSHYRGLIAARDDAARLRRLEEIEDPLARAIAAGALLRAGAASPEVIAVATRTTSDQGWRRALLAWLGVQAARAEAAGDAQALALIRQRMGLVQESLPRER
ncbi:MAG: hypothetical protein RMK60_00270 [Burkholderiales bacterium]|nr:hypothetical protein [Burkholderiales bacterium]